MSMESRTLNRRNTDNQQNFANVSIPDCTRTSDTLAYALPPDCLRCPPDVFIGCLPGGRNLAASGVCFELKGHNLNLDIRFTILYRLPALQ